MFHNYNFESIANIFHIGYMIYEAKFPGFNKSRFLGYYMGYILKYVITFPSCQIHD